MQPKPARLPEATRRRPRLIDNEIGARQQQ
jgi:hypothetical protein